MTDKITQSTETKSTTACVMCKSKIFIGATICPICKNYQSTWKRRAHYCVTRAGIFTVFISLLAYVASTCPEIRKTLLWQDALEIAALDSKNSIILQNSGDGRVFASHLSLRSDALGYSGAILINKTIESKTFLAYDLKIASTDLSKWKTISMSDSAWQALLRERQLKENECVQWRFFVPEDPAYQTLKKHHGNSFHDAPIDATLYFRSGRDNRQHLKDVKVVAVPFINQTCILPNGTIKF